MANNVICDNNISYFRERFNRARWAAAYLIAIKAESYAKAAAPIYDDVNLAAYIRQQVTEDSDGALLIVIGSDLELVAYGEVGTATLYEPPEDFIENLVPEGKHKFGRRGISEWWYYDDARHTFERGYSHPAHHFLQRAITDHAEEYARDAEAELRAVDI